MLRLHLSITCLLLLALLVSACQPLTIAPRITSVTAIEITCRTMAGEEQEVDGVIHHRGQRDDGVVFASDSRLDGVDTNLIDWDYVAATGGGTWMATTVITPTVGGGTWVAQSAGYFVADLGGFHAVAYGTGEFAGLEIVLNGVGTELETALALIAGNDRIVDGNPCAPMAREIDEASLWYGQIIDRRPVPHTPSQ